MSVHDEITTTIDRFAGAWKNNDGAALAALFAEEGSLINPFGGRADRRAAVGSMYAEYFAGMLRGTSTTFTLGTIRQIGSGHAFIDGEQTLHGADGSVVLVVHLAALLHRDADTWRFVDARPYVFAAIPG